MAEYNNELSGVLWKNDQKGNNNAPWYRGKIQINGQEYELAAWLRESKKDGSKFLSLKASIKEERREYEPAPELDDVPF